jgi:hypothetical protein
MGDNKLCPSCNNAIPADAVFCPNCGSVLTATEAAEAVQAEEMPATPTEQEAINVPESPDSVDTAPEPEPEQPNEPEISQGPVQQPPVEPKPAQTVSPQPAAPQPQQPQPQPAYVPPQQAYAQPQQPYPQQAPQYYQQQPPYVQPQTPPKPKKKFPWIFTILWIVMLAFVGVWVFLWTTYPEGQKPEITIDTLRVVSVAVSAVLLIYTLNLKLATKKLRALPTLLLIICLLLSAFMFCAVELIEGDFAHDVISPITDNLFPMD